MTFSPENDFEELDNSELEEEQEQKTRAVGKPRWYVVQVASGCEKKVKTDIEQRKNSFDLNDRIVEVRIPQAPAIRVKKDGSRYQSEEKVFPGYVLVNMILDDDAWQMVKNTANVINFVGSETKRPYGRGRGHVKPMPLSPSEVDRIFKQMDEAEPVVKVDFLVGDKIMVTNGPFKDFAGEVIEISAERSKLKALLSIFGRDTPVELEFNQVEKQG